VPVGAPAHHWESSLGDASGTTLARGTDWSRFGAFAAGGSKESTPTLAEGMAATAPRFDRMVPAAPDTVGALRRELRRWARRQGASPAVQANVALAFSEACMSLIGPAPPVEGAPGPLMVQAWSDGGEIGVRVSHRSRGAPSPPVGVGYGFGLALMARVCDRFEVRRRDDRPGTAVLMTFSLERERPPARSSPRPPSRSTTRR
jgi:anti-sigma regulatory factor (Ser/Thr protein kinase)